jgi:hypothetical protein
LLSLSVLFLLGLLMWAMIALSGWFFSQVQIWSAAAPEAARGALATVERAGGTGGSGGAGKTGRNRAHHQRGEPAAARCHRHRHRPCGALSGPHAHLLASRRQADHRALRGSGRLLAVLDHYVRGFTALGYTQELQSATPEAETHAWIKGNQHYLAKIVSNPRAWSRLTSKPLCHDQPRLARIFHSSSDVNDTGQAQAAGFIQPKVQVSPRMTRISLPASLLAG